MKKSIHVRILYYFLIITFLSISSISSLAIYKANEALRENTIGNFEKISEELYFNVNKIIHKGFQDIELIVNDPVISSEVIPWQKKKNELIKLKDILKNYEDITLIDLYGNVITSTDYNYRGDWKYQKHFKEAKKGGFAKSNVHLIPDPLKEIISFAGPVYNKDKKLIAVISIQLNMNSIWEIVDHLKIGRTGYAFIIDENYKIISHPDKNLIMDRYNKEKLTRFFTSNEINESPHRIMIGNYFSCDKMKSSYRPHISQNHANWNIIVLQSKEEIFASFDIFKKNVIIFTILLFFIVAIISFRVSQAITKPLKELMAGTSIIAKGNLSHRVMIKGEDEVKELADSFNNMAEELKSYQDRLISALNRLQILTDTTPDGVLIHKPDGTIIDINQTCTKIYGYKKDELLKLNIGQLSGEHYTQEMGMENINLAMEGKILDFEWTGKTKNGKEFPLNVRLRKMHLQDGDYIIAIITDITEMKKTRDELKKAHDELEARVKEQTKHLLKANEELQTEIAQRKRTEEELREAKEQAEQANRAKSQFLATMSHEIRTPMNAIMGMTTLLSDTKLTDEQKDFCKTIRTSSDALLSIINDILDFSKIESGKFELEDIIFELKECVEESLDLVAAKASEKKLELIYTIDTTVPPWITGDITRLRQVLVNLLSNAVKFTEKGEIVVSVSGENIKHNNYKLNFSVRDTGIGISQEGQKLLFKSFSQVDASTTRKYGGTGLGLAISKRLVELMGGEMWLESKEGKGTIFYFTIMTCSAPGVETKKLYLEELAGKRILVVDDNLTNRIILSRQLFSWNMMCHSAASGIEAIELIKGGVEFDVAILDMEMPEMDGAKLTQEIRKYKTHIQLPIIILTSLGGKETREKDIKVEAFLTKPIKFSQLHNTILSILSGKKKSEEKTDLKINGESGKSNPLKILLAEDNAINQKVALKILSRIGYDADVAANGYEVIEAMKIQTYDVILMDVNMPEMDGLEATKLIRKNSPYQPSIIAMTADAMKEDKDKCINAGMDNYISKPINIEHLIQVLGQTKK